MDAALMGTDAAGITGNLNEGVEGRAQFGGPALPPENDFISRAGGGITSFNKGDLVIGGTNLMGGNDGMMQALERNNQLLESILNKDTDVKMNTYSVQSALVVDNFKNG